MTKIRIDRDYRTARRAAYPPLEEFAEAFVEAHADNPAALPAPLRAYVERCRAVKERFKKPAK